MTQAVSGFGLDTSCTTSIRSGQFVSGPRLVAEAAYRRLTTPRGMLRGGDDERNYGFDMSELIGSVSTDSDAVSLEGKIRNELFKDERILTVDVNVTVTTSGPAVAFDVEIKATTREGPFTLAVRVSEVSVELLGIQG
ncbi:MAG: hypothetical protein FWD69_10535 [Polyangiaceae bacterium]|nr:hypothetical protein [Polyangiaceae bacterium]